MTQKELSKLMQLLTEASFHLSGMLNTHLDAGDLDQTETQAMRLALIDVGRAISEIHSLTVREE